ncbi:hypothetical protein HP2RS_03952 [Helicobacter pylori]|nr:hypothetical protein HP2RS_03952 [Helicobacter pylori]OUC11082.1 hypothetical protein X568_02535 [Helicobacter pylori SS1]
MFLKKVVGKIDFLCFLDKSYLTLFNFLKVGF